MKQTWQIKKLSEVCQIRPSKAEARTRLSDIDLVSFVPMEDLGIDQKMIVPKQTRPFLEVSGSYTFFAENDVLLAKITPCFENGKLGIAANLTNGIGFGSSEYIVFRPHPSVMNNEWLYYFLARDTFRQLGVKHMSGAVGHKRVSKEFIEAYEIPIPPLSEQKRIVAVLDEAFESISTAKANTEKNLQNARALFEHFLQSVFDLKNGDSAEKRLNEASEIFMGQSPSGDTYNTIGNGVPLINGPVEFSDDPFGRTIRSKFTTLPTKICKQNDLILCVRGSTTGRTNIAGFDACIGRGVAAIRAKEFQPWINYFIRAKRKDIYKLGTGSTFPNVSSSILGGIKLPFPSLSKQKEIVNQLDDLSTETRRLESIYERKLVALGELKKSLLAHAFNGEL